MKTNFKNFYYGGTYMDEDSTKYGEFISSYFAWLTLERQKEISEKLENMTKK